MSGHTPPVMAQQVISAVQVLREQLRNMLDADQYEGTVSDALQTIEDGIEEAMGEAYAEGRQDGRDERRP